MAYQAPYSGLAQLMEMQGRGPDTRLVHMTPMELRTLQAMSPTGRLTTNPETGLPEAGILEDILPAALPLAGSILFPMAAPTLLGSSILPAAVGAGLGSTAAGLFQGKSLSDSLIQGGLSGLMSYGLGSAMGAFAPSGGVTAAPPDIGAVTPGGAEAVASDVLSGAGGLMAPSNVTATVQPSFADITAPRVIMTQTTPDAASMATLQQTTAAASDPGFGGFLGGIGEKLSTPIAPETLGGATYGSALGAGASGLLASDLLKEPYDVADMDMMEDYYPAYDADLEGGRERGIAAARRLNRPPAYASSGDLYRMASSPSGFGTFFAAEGGPVRLQTGGTATNPYGQPYGPGDAYGAKKYYPESDGEPDVVDVPEYTNIHGPVAGLLSAIGMAALNAPIGGKGAFGTLASIPGRGIGLTNPIEDFIIGQPNATTPSRAGNVMTYHPDRGLTFAADPTSVAETLSLMAGYGDFAGESTAYDNDPQDTYGTATPDMGSFDDGGGSADVGDMGGIDGSEEGAAGGFAQGGGISSLAYGGDPSPMGFANQAFEGMVPGQGTGMSDSVPFSIEGQQPALLSRDEYVLPADVVSQLGDGSSGAGADMLDNFVSRLRQSKYGNSQQPPANGGLMMNNLMRQGGVV